MARPATSWFVVAALVVACASGPRPEVLAPTTLVVGAPDGAPSQSGSSPAAAPPSAAAPWAVLEEPPDGEANVGVFLERGQRQPANLIGPLARIGPATARGAHWQHVELSGAGAAARRSFDLLLTPEALPLPLGVGEHVDALIDCRKGGWERVCDVVVRDRRHALRVAIAGSGDARLLSGWKVTRGEAATSEVFAESPRSVRNTHALVFRFEGKSVTVAPLTWRRLDTSSGSWFVTGYELSWEGARPPGAVDQRRWAVVRRR